MYRNYLKVFIQCLLPKKILTFLAGKLAEVQNPLVKNFIIKQFIQKFKVNMREANRESPAEYKNFNDFFIRQLKPGLRPVSDADIVSPVDGQISEAGRLDQDKMIQAKGHYYTVSALLGADDHVSRHFLNGYFATIYLAPKDYHRIHMPIDGQLEKTIYIPGRLNSVQPATASVITGLFARNERLVVIFNTSIGKMAMVLVGAAIVGAIGTSWGGDIKRVNKTVSSDYQNQNIVLKKGTEMGYFKLGSTVILLYEKSHNLKWVESISKESFIRYGMPLANKQSEFLELYREEDSNFHLIS